MRFASLQKILFLGILTTALSACGQNSQPLVQTSSPQFAVGEELALKVADSEKLALVIDPAAVQEWTDANKASDQSGLDSIRDERLHWMIGPGQLKLLVLQDDSNARNIELVKVRLISSSCGVDPGTKSNEKNWEPGQKGWMISTKVKECVAAAKKTDEPAAIVKAPARMQIRTYQDFEKSFLFKELNFSNLKSPTGYRIYKDRNNNYVVALQIDPNGTILCERILPMPKVASKAQSTGMLFFIMDFIFGDGAALNDIAATKQMKTKTKAMTSLAGAQVGDFRVSLAQDSWKIRAGFDVKTKTAKPWNLAFPAPAVVASTNTDSVNNSNSPDESVEAPSKVELRVVELERQLRQTQKQLSEANNSLKTALADSKTVRSALESQYNDRFNKLASERDVSLGKLRNLQDLLDAYETRFGKNSPPRNSPGVPSTLGLSAQSSIGTVDNTPNPSDSYVSGLAGFNPNQYRRDVERRIWSSLTSLTSSDVPSCVKVQVSFDILSDGSPNHISVKVLEPMPGSDDAELEKTIEKRTKNIILAAGPFRPVSYLPVSSIRINVDLVQIFEGGSNNCSVVAHFAEKPNVLSSRP